LDTECSSSEEEPLRTPLTEDEGLGSGGSVFRRDFLQGHISYFQQQQLEAAASRHLSPRKSPAAISLPFSRPLTPSPPASAQSYHSLYQAAPAAHHSPQIHRFSSHPELASFRYAEPLQPIAIPSLSLHIDDDLASPLDVAMDDEPLSPDVDFPLLGQVYSDRFPVEHELNSSFVDAYELEDELGAGGYGFVMTARHRIDGYEAAVKFIIKDKVPAHAWVEDDCFGRIPSEVMLVSLLEHDNIVRCLDIFEDSLYFYLVWHFFDPIFGVGAHTCTQVQELHGSPWVTKKKPQHQPSDRADHQLAVPSLTPSSSCSTLDSLPLMTPHPTDTAAWEAQLEQFRRNPPQPEALDEPKQLTCGRRASHDLFECIEQSKNKRLPESQAQRIFAQVVEAVHHLETLGITHRDIKDENLVIDSDLKVICFYDGRCAASSITAIGEADRLWERRGFRPCAAAAILPNVLWHHGVRRPRDSPEEEVSGSTCGDLDARRPLVLPAHWIIAVPL
jgi:hypothetical protein